MSVLRVLARLILEAELKILREGHIMPRDSGQRKSPIHDGYSAHEKSAPRQRQEGTTPDASES